MIARLITYFHQLLLIHLSRINELFDGAGAEETIYVYISCLSKIDTRDPLPEDHVQDLGTHVSNEQRALIGNNLLQLGSIVSEVSN